MIKDVILDDKTLMLRIIWVEFSSINLTTYSVMPITEENWSGHGNKTTRMGQSMSNSNLLLEIKKTVDQHGGKLPINVSTFNKNAPRPILNGSSVPDHEMASHRIKIFKLHGKSAPTLGDRTKGCGITKHP